MNAVKQLGHTPRLTGRVTDEILDAAMERNSNHCMIAEAIKKANPRLKCVSVDIQTCRASDYEKQERYVWLTPRRLQLAIINFDKGKRPKPFLFELRDGQTIPSGRKKGKNPKSKLRRPKNGNAQSVPVRVGGEAPPRAVGRRRAFGLRSLEY